MTTASVPALALVPMPFLQAYSAEVQQHAQAMLQCQEVGTFLQQRYPTAHTIRSDKALFEYAQTLKHTHMRHSEPLNKVQFDSNCASARSTT
jgi:UTP pyrophosphatase